MTTSLLSSACRTVTVGGKGYKNLSALYRELHPPVSMYQLRKWHRDGVDPEPVFLNPGSVHNMTTEGGTYPSLVMAQPVVKRPRIPVSINGVQYPSVTAACRTLDCPIPPYTVRARLRRGDFPQAIFNEETVPKKRAKEVGVGGVTFPSLIEAYRSLKPPGSYPMICRWLRDGMDPTEAFTRKPMRKGRPQSLPRPSRRGFTMKGVFYQSCADAYRRLKPPASYGTIQHRIRQGMSRLRAFSLPPRPQIGRGDGKPITRI